MTPPNNPISTQKILILLAIFNIQSSVVRQASIFVSTVSTPKGSSDTSLRDPINIFSKKCLATIETCASDGGSRNIRPKDEFQAYLDVVSYVIQKLKDKQQSTTLEYSDILLKDFSDKSTDDKIPALRDELEECRTKHNNDVISLCLGEINRGNFENAAKYLEKSDYPLIETIVKRAYLSSKSDSKVDNILEFANNIPMMLQRAKITETLYTLIKNSNGKNSPQFLVLDSYINGLTIENNKMDTVQVLDSFKENLDSSTQGVIYSWILLIQKGDFQKIADFSNSYSIVFSKNIGKIVEMAFKENSTNAATNIFEFAKILTNRNLSAKTYIALYRQMDKMNAVSLYHGLKIAYQVKLIYENAAHLEYGLFSQLNALKNKFPQYITDIVWGIPLCLGNSKHILTVGGEYDNERHSVFPSLQLNHTGKWVFEASNQAETFRIKNTYYDEYLYAATDQFSYDINMRRVFTWRLPNAPDFGHWKIKPINNKGLDMKKFEFLLYDTDYNEYLNIGEPVPQMKLFTWKLSGYGPFPHWYVFHC